MNFDAKKHEIGDIGSFSNRNVPFVKARMGEVVRRSRRNFGREGTWESSINNSLSYNWLCLSVTNVGESPASIPLVKEGFQLRRIPIRSSRDRTILALSPGSGFNSSLGSKWALELFSIWAWLLFSLAVLRNRASSKAARSSDVTAIAVGLRRSIVGFWWTIVENKCNKIQSATGRFSRSVERKMLPMHSFMHVNSGHGMAFTWSYPEILLCQLFGYAGSTNLHRRHNTIHSSWSSLLLQWGRKNASNSVAPGIPIQRTPAFGRGNHHLVPPILRNAASNGPIVRYVCFIL